MANRDRTAGEHDYRLLRELRYEYCNALDRHDWEGYLELFTDDVRFDASGVPEMDVIEGKRKFREFVTERVAGSSVFSMHQAYHPMLDIQGDTGSGRWGLNEIVVRPDGAVWWRQGSYTDTYRRVEGTWKFEAVEVAIDGEAELDVDVDVRS
jgi:hypothetical protein